MPGDRREQIPTEIQQIQTDQTCKRVGEDSTKHAKHNNDKGMTNRIGVKCKYFRQSFRSEQPQGQASGCEMGKNLVDLSHMADIFKNCYLDMCSKRFRHQAGVMVVI